MERTSDDLDVDRHPVGGRAERDARGGYAEKADQTAGRQYFPGGLLMAVDDHRLIEWE